MGYVNRKINNFYTNPILGIGYRRNYCMAFSFDYDEKNESMSRIRFRQKKFDKIFPFCS